MYASFGYICKGSRSLHTVISISSQVTCYRWRAEISNTMKKLCCSGKNLGVYISVTHEPHTFLSVGYLLMWILCQDNGLFSFFFRIFNCQVDFKVSRCSQVWPEYFLPLSENTIHSIITVPELGGCVLSFIIILKTKKLHGRLQETLPVCLTQVRKP